MIFDVMTVSTCKNCSSVHHCFIVPINTGNKVMLQKGVGDSYISYPVYQYTYMYMSPQLTNQSNPS